MGENPELTPVLVGAVLALATAVLVQSVVVPWVQARTRRRERWEDAVMELVILLEEQLPRALREFREAAREERDLNRQVRQTRDEVAHWLRVQLPTEADAPLLSAMLELLSLSPFDLRPGSHANAERHEHAWTDRRRAADGVASQVKRARLLTARVTSLRPQAPAWVWFKMGELQLSMTTHALTGSMTVSSMQPTEDEWSRMLGDQDQAQRAFMELLEPLALSMHPPATQLARRTSWRLKALLRALVTSGRVRKANAPTDGRSRQSSSQANEPERTTADLGGVLDTRTEP